MSNLVKEERP